MELDELKKTWAAHGALLERSVAIDERLLRELLLRKVRLAIAPYALWMALEVALGVAALLVVVPVLAAHFSEPRYLVAGGSVALFTFVITAMTAYLLVNGLQLDYGGAVTSLQRNVERLKLVEYRTFKWALLGGVLVWLPGLLVLFEAGTGVNALARVDLSWLAANLAVGVIVLGLGQLLSKKYVERSDLNPWARRVIDACSGRGLRSAAAHLAELSRFEREERPLS